MSGNSERIENLVRELLVELGEDPEREGLVEHAEARCRVPRLS